MPDPNAVYDPEQYWGEVGLHISERAEPSVLAGDDEPFDQLKRRKFLEHMLSKLPIAGKSCLEVGCGPGGNLVALQSLGPARLVGADISQTMVDLARATTGGSVEITKIDGRVLPFDDNEFDVVFCATVLMHNIDDVTVPLVAEMCRVASRNVVLFEEVTQRRKDRYSYFKRTATQYVAMCRMNGYDLEHLEYLHHEILQKLCRVPRRLLNTRGTHEGATRNRASRLIERAMIRTFGWVDDVVPLKSGLAEMAFLRRSTNEAPI